MPSGRRPDGAAPSSNAERQAATACITGRGNRTAAVARSVGALPSPSYSRCRPSSTPPGSKHCLKRFKALRRPMPCKPSLILTSTAVTDETSGLAGARHFHSAG